MTEHKVGTQEQRQAAREELLREENELTRRSDELAREEGGPEPMWVRSQDEYAVA